MGGERKMKKKKEKTGEEEKRRPFKNGIFSIDSSGEHLLCPMCFLYDVSSSCMDKLLPHQTLLWRPADMRANSRCCASLQSSYLYYLG